jgi:hypothetical protein
MHPSRQSRSIASPDVRGSVPDLYGARAWTKGREFSSLRVPRRHSWARTPGILSVIMSVSQNSI